MRGDPRGSVGICPNLFSALLSDSSGEPRNLVAQACHDGWARYDWLGQSTPPLCVPYSVAFLVSRYIDDQDRIRYADFGLFTGAPLPAPTDCPAAPGAQVCGGSCPNCDGGRFCSGRSPLHPHGFCAAETYDLPCSLDVYEPDRKCQDPGMGCFTFTVEPAAQALADKNGICLPLEQCKALAAGLPGGGTCTPQP